MMFLTEEQELLRQTVRDFAQNELKPRAAKFDEQEFIDKDLLAAMGELGLMGICFPEQYGGTGMDRDQPRLRLHRDNLCCARIPGC
jgi:alkylation response protein AidB-like acyl-CoA dehydrogenase